MGWNGVENAQVILRMVAGYAGAIDGDPGPRSLAAAGRIEGLRDPRASLSAARRVIAAGQIALRQAGFDPGPADGLWGPSTDAAFEAWACDLAGVGFVDRSAENAWGREVDLVRRFGAPGSAICTMGRVRIPWRTVLAWDETQEVSTIACHADVEASLARVLENVADTHTPDQITDLGLHLYGGCFNDRLKRGGSTKSVHAWGVAVDWDPARNRLQWGRDRARLALPDAARFWAAWAAEGWTGLGPAKNFDWMHIQAPAL
jgi:hypothetical protein